MNTLIGYDLVPEAKIIDSALRACRRLNDLASAIRILEAVKVRLRPSAGGCFPGGRRAPVLVGKRSVFAGQSRTSQRHLPLPDPRAEAHLVRTRNFNSRGAGNGQVIGR